MKALIKITSTLLLAVIALGCASRAKTPPTAPPATATRPAPEPKPDYSSAESCWGLVRLVKKAPAAVSLGEQFAYEIVALAQCDVAEVVITDILPEGATYVSSEPAGTREGNRLTWRAATMQRGQSQTFRIVVKADKEGELVNCATVTAIPRTCVSTMVGKATLAIQKTGPATAVLNSDVTYNIVVRNTGNAIARDVVVTDPVPEGFSHASGQKSLTAKLGNLAPGESKSIPVVLKAGKRGRICNVAQAESANAGKVNAEACTTIVQPGLKIVKTGDKQQFITRRASYKIVVSNIGDTALTGVVVTDTAPEGTAIVSAEGAAVAGNVATWNVGQLEAGAEKAFTVVLSSRVAGSRCNVASVTTTQGLRESAEACTLWRGVAGVLLEVVDDPDPIQVGENTTYTIRVTNQGSADLTNLRIEAVFDEEADPVSSDQGRIEGKKVSFPVVATLGAKQSFQYRIVAKGVKPGDSRNKVILTANETTSPVVEEESTTVY